eukprot:gnl/MRDRNA2_/MRDRNA2_48225_c0_seq2.p1 gnl/MRDRNA2_/MRDRNA2_48225_c0~~gnl/MRDRNA2_/MRDRNA2_48225_c0_seq2.p1  ORF type:complete len:217 (-),score=53.06 gnl/MRDRNA2_/MRDRNA2_48225_c0_seq2:49-654(-)
MEVQLDVPPDQESPGECIVAVHVGKVQKQTRLCSSLLKFPGVFGEVQYGRLEVFKRIGACSMTFGPGSIEQKEVQIPCSEAGLKEVSFRMSVSNTGQVVASDEIAQKANRSKRQADAVLQYLKLHQVEDLVAEGMKLLMRDKPKNPHRFLANHFLLHQPAEQPACTKVLPPPCYDKAPDPKKPPNKMKPLIPSDTTGAKAK